MSKHPTESLDQAAHKQIEESAFADIDRVAFVDAITELKKKDMKIILLRFFCEMKYEKIAQNMGYTDRKPAHMAFTRAINKLRIILTKKNIL